MQGKDDPAPGYYVSTTALNNPGPPRDKPARYVNAALIPYIVLPRARYRQFVSGTPLRLGDLGVALNVETGVLCFAQFAEIGPERSIGEASIALAEALGINADPKKGGTAQRKLLYMVFPGTGVGRGLDPEDIQARVEPLFETWGGLARLQSYAGI